MLKSLLFMREFWWVAGKLAEISNPPHSANAEIMYSFSASARWRTYESYRKPIIFAGTDLGGNISHGILAGTLLTLRIILIDLSTTHVLTCYFSCEPDIDSRVNLMQLPCVGHHRLVCVTWFGLIRRVGFAIHDISQTTKILQYLVVEMAVNDMIWCYYHRHSLVVSKGCILARLHVKYAIHMSSSSYNILSILTMLW